MSGIVFDTSVYITAFRQGDSILDLRQAVRRSDGKSYPVWFSSVVLSELLIGTNTKKDRKKLLDTAKSFVKVKRILIPNLSDWSLTGDVLALIGLKYGYEQVGRARMTNDAFIAMSVARNGLTVLTKNAADFIKIAEFRQFNWEEI
jgi:predicted nucleic acid-binding protein